MSFGEIVSGVSQTMTTSDETTEDRTLRFTYLNMRGIEEELCDGGKERTVWWVERGGRREEWVGTGSNKCH